MASVFSSVSILRCKIFLPFNIYVDVKNITFLINIILFSCILLSITFYIIQTCVFLSRHNYLLFCTAVNKCNSCIGYSCVSEHLYTFVCLVLKFCSLCESASPSNTFLFVQFAYLSFTCVCVRARFCWKTVALTACILFIYSCLFCCTRPLMQN